MREGERERNGGTKREREQRGKEETKRRCEEGKGGKGGGNKEIGDREGKMNNEIEKISPCLYHTFAKISLCIKVVRSPFPQDEALCCVAVVSAVG